MLHKIYPAEFYDQIHGDIQMELILYHFRYQLWDTWKTTNWFLEHQTMLYQIILFYFRYGISFFSSGNFQRI